MAKANPGKTPEAKSDEASAQINRLVGERLLILRQARGLTLAMVAERLGVSYQQIQKYERGSSTLSVARLFEFAQIYETAPSEFFRDLPTHPGLDSPRSAEVENFAQSPEGHRLLTAIAPMPSAARKALLDLLRPIPQRRELDG